MKRISRPEIFLGMLLFGSSGILLASDADKLQEQIEAMREKAAVVAEHAKKEAALGNTERAERLKKEAQKMREASEQMALKAREQGKDNVRPAIDQVTRHLKELSPQPEKLTEAKASEKRRAEGREQVARGSREPQVQHAGNPGIPLEVRAHAEKLEAAARRIHHLRVAAENLKMAEAHDLAHEIMERAEAMERDVREGRKRLEAEMQNIHRQERGPEHAPDIVHALKKEIEQLRAEVKELRQNLEKR